MNFVDEERLFHKQSAHCIYLSPNEQSVIVQFMCKENSDPMLTVINHLFQLCHHKAIHERLLAFSANPLNIVKRFCMPVFWQNLYTTSKQASIIHGDFIDI